MFYQKSNRCSLYNTEVMLKRIKKKIATPWHSTLGRFCLCGFCHWCYFCNEPESTAMTVAVSFFMGCHRTKQVCLDIMGGHIYISCVWTSFFASSPHPPKKYLYFPLRTKNKISQHAKSTFWEWAWLCLEHQEGRQQSNLSEEMLLLWRFLNRMTNSLGPVVLYIWDSSSYKVKNNYNVYELNFTCEMSRI